MDAGSSHTGIFLYKWKPVRATTGLSLSNTGEKITAAIPSDIKQIEKFNIREGINNIDESQIAAYLKPQMSKLEERVTELLELNKSDSDPTKPNSQVPLFLEATAGMRLLKVANAPATFNLIRRIDSVLRTYKTLSYKHALLISGTFEGLYSWITVNYLIDSLAPGKKTAAIVECGGASTQIAYQMKPKSARTAINQHKLDSDEVHEIGIRNERRTVRSSSYLCYGKDQFHLRLYRILIYERQQADPTFSSNINPQIADPCANTNSETVQSKKSFEQSPCIKPNASAGLNSLDEFNATTTFFFIGNSYPAKCLEYIQKILNQTTCSQYFDSCYTYHNVVDDDNMDFYGISAFYYAAAFVTESKNKSIFVDPVTYMNQTNKLCLRNSAELDHSNPFIKTQCFANLLIYGLIENFYQIKDWSRINFVRKIKDDSIGWTLGSMLVKARLIDIKQRSKTHLPDAAFYAICILAGFILFISSICFAWTLYKYYAASESSSTSTDPEGASRVNAARFGHSFTKRLN